MTVNTDTLLSKNNEEKNCPTSLKENIHTILHGSRKEKEGIKGKFFYIADTPEFMKKLGLTGDYFSIRYGIITRHKDKDNDHNLSEQNWVDICDAITKPFAIAKHEEGYRLFISIKSSSKYIAVGVKIKSFKKGLEVNSVSTAFKYNNEGFKNQEIIFLSKKISLEQAALLDGLNSLSLPPVQGL